VRVIDGTGTNVAPSVVKTLADQGFTTTQGTPVTGKIAVSEIRYGYGQAEEAKALIPYLPDAKLVPDADANDAVVLVLGTSFSGSITVPSTTTTAPTSSTVPGAPVTTRPPVTTQPRTTTSTTEPDPSESCPQ
jgi:LytR cell envelope-related transcriptional attenuator